MNAIGPISPNTSEPAACLHEPGRALAGSSPPVAWPEELSLAEKTTLHQCEQTISRDRTAFIEVGRSLQQIQSRKLYRADFKTFDQYCRKQWQFGRSYEIGRA